MLCSVIHRNNYHHTLPSTSYTRRYSLGQAHRPVLWERWADTAKHLVWETQTSIQHSSSTFKTKFRKTSAQLPICFVWWFMHAALQSNSSNTSCFLKALIQASEKETSEQLPEREPPEPGQMADQVFALHAGVGLKEKASHLPHGMWCVFNRWYSQSGHIKQ